MNTMDTVPEDASIGLPPVCTIKNTNEILRDMLSCASRSGKIILDGSRVESVDICFVQLVVSAVATVGTGTAAFELRDPTPCIGTAFARAGLAGFAGITGGV